MQLRASLSLAAIIVILGLLSFKASTNTKDDRESVKVLVQHKPYVGECERRKVYPSETECLQLEKEEIEDKNTYPLQYVSGAPGSGNDWILWLASPSRYTSSRIDRQRNCEIYKRKNSDELIYVKNSQCLFLKSHEPWFFEDWSTYYTRRSVLLLRHPYDAAFAEYKRQLAVQAGVNLSTDDLKHSTQGQTVDRFVDLKSNRTSIELTSHIRQYINKWQYHTTYWLTLYAKPLHVLIYNSVKTDAAKEIEEMQKFLGYNFDGPNFRRHCCAMAKPYKEELKRAFGLADKYKEYAYEQDAGIRTSANVAAYLANQMLRRKFPKANYRITRG